jgi:hypothetical protein
VNHPNTAVWLCAAVDPTDEERAWLSRGFVGYLAAPGYGEMFTEAGYGELVEFARTRPGPKELFARMPPDLIDQVALVGSESEVRHRIAEYAGRGHRRDLSGPARPRPPQRRANPRSPGSDRPQPRLSPDVDEPPCTIVRQEGPLSVTAHVPRSAEQPRSAACRRGASLVWMRHVDDGETVDPGEVARVAGMDR